MIGTVEEGREDMGTASDEARAGRPADQAPAGLGDTATIASAVLNAWQVAAAERTVALIRKVGIYGLGGNDGCPCTNFAVLGVNVDVSCHKSEQSVRVYSSHMDWLDDGYRKCEAALKPVADEVLRQVDAWYDGGGEYAAGFAVHYQSWNDDHAQAIEARQGGDGEAGSVHESAAPKGCAK